LKRFSLVLPVGFKGPDPALSEDASGELVYFSDAKKALDRAEWGYRRDCMAGAALNGLLAGGHDVDDDEDTEEVVAVALGLADAMVERMMRKNLGLEEGK
jgi:hypothetical protein